MKVCFVSENVDEPGRHCRKEEDCPQSAPPNNGACDVRDMICHYQRENCCGETLYGTQARCDGKFWRIIGQDRCRMGK